MGNPLKTAFVVDFTLNYWWCICTLSHGRCDICLGLLNGNAESNVRGVSRVLYKLRYQWFTTYNSLEVNTQLSVMGCCYFTIFIWTPIIIKVKKKTIHICSWKLSFIIWWYYIWQWTKTEMEKLPYPFQ